MYISIGKSINIIGTNFTTSSAPKGNVLYAEEIDGTLTINNAQIRDIDSSDANGYIMGVSSSSLNITDSVFENINSPLFFLSDVTTSIDNSTFNQISCPKSSNSFCLLKMTSSDTVQITNSSMTNINSNVDLISLSYCPEVLFSNVTVQNILKSTQENLDQIFVLNVLDVKNLSIADQTTFSKIGFSGVKTKNTSLTIQNSTYSNRLQTGRLLSQSTDDSLSSAKLNQIIQFIVLDTSNSTLTGTSFIENSLNTLVDGGVISLLLLELINLDLGNSNSWFGRKSYDNRLYV